MSSRIVKALAFLAVIVLIYGLLIAAKYHSPKYILMVTLPALLSIIIFAWLNSILEKREGEKEEYQRRQLDFYRIILNNPRLTAREFWETTSLLTESKAKSILAIVVDKLLKSRAILFLQSCALEEMFMKYKVEIVDMKGAGSAMDDLKKIQNTLDLRKTEYRVYWEIAQKDGFLVCKNVSNYITTEEQEELKKEAERIINPDGKMKGYF
ncbi:MAG: hypothetical protein AAB503_01415 [Patescibacteria group bacterium]